MRGGATALLFKIEFIGNTIWVIISWNSIRL